jgi:branched-subunit amino acid aminotransferase/4-amino-4-deoxychorismate lyase
MVNELGECTETTIANLMVRRGGDWFTPSLSSGCLPGIGREIVLENARVTERVILIDDLRHAEEIVVVNSLRGWRRARLSD